MTTIISIPEYNKIIAFLFLFFISIDNIFLLLFFLLFYLFISHTLFLIMMYNRVRYIFFIGMRMLVLSHIKWDIMCGFIIGRLVLIWWHIIWRMTLVREIGTSCRGVLNGKYIVSIMWIYNYHQKMKGFVDICIKESRSLNEKNRNMSHFGWMGQIWVVLLL